MRLARKGPAYRDASKETRVLRAYGLPSRYWDVTVEQGIGLIERVRTIAVTRSYNNAALSVSAARQRKTLQSLLTSPDGLGSSRVVVIGSIPTDELGMIIAAAVMQRARNLKLRPLCVSMRHTIKEDVAHEPDVVVLHNMTPECHANRAQICRDWLDRFDDTLRIVVVGGTDPYTFCHTRLFCPFDDAIYFEGELREDL